MATASARASESCGSLETSNDPVSMTTCASAPRWRRSETRHHWPSQAMVGRTTSSAATARAAAWTESAPGGSSSGPDRLDAVEAGQGADDRVPQGEGGQAGSLVVRRPTRSSAPAPARRAAARAASGRGAKRTASMAARASTATAAATRGQRVRLRGRAAPARSRVDRSSASRSRPGRRRPVAAAPMRAAREAARSRPAARPRAAAPAGRRARSFCSSSPMRDDEGRREIGVQVRDRRRRPRR